MASTLEHARLEPGGLTLADCKDEADVQAAVRRRGYEVYFSSLTRLWGCGAG